MWTAPDVDGADVAGAGCGRKAPSRWFLAKPPDVKYLHPCSFWLANQMHMLG
jgi:hypothetical protein